MVRKAKDRRASAWPGNLPLPRFNHWTLVRFRVIWSAFALPSGDEAMDQRTDVIPEIEHVDLDRPLAGNEGLNVNYISRIRTQYLFAQHQALLTQVQFADAKAIALVTLIGVMLFRGPIAPGSFDVANWLHVGFFVLGFAGLFFCLLAVIPRYPARDQRADMARRDRWSWPALASSPAMNAEFIRFMQTAEVSQLVQSVSLSNSAVSRILLSKYAMLRTAFLFSMGALLVLLLDVLQLRN
ncbi:MULTISPECIES: hypothetical protein [unclassified Roseitalea]|nr:MULTISPECIES: hypothetical protein [unclassified Roseitalea]